MGEADTVDASLIFLFQLFGLVNKLQAVGVVRIYAEWFQLFCHSRIHCPGKGGTEVVQPLEHHLQKNILFLVFLQFFQQLLFLLFHPLVFHKILLLWRDLYGS